MIRVSSLFTNVCNTSWLPLTLSLSPCGGEGIEDDFLSLVRVSARERVGVRVPLRSRIVRVRG